METCSWCGENLRPWGAKEDEHPGTSARGSVRLCKTCYRKGGRLGEHYAERVLEWELIEAVDTYWKVRALGPLAFLPPCAWCGRPLRPFRARAQDYPGTVATGAKGMCITCYERAKRLGSGTLEDLERQSKRVLDNAEKLYWERRKGGPLEARAVL